MFHQKTVKMGHFNGKDPLKMINGILLHLTIRSSDRLFHYIVVKKWEVLTVQIVSEIIVFKVEKNVFLQASQFWVALILEAFEEVNFVFFLELFFLIFLIKLVTCSKNFITFQIGEHVPKNSNRELASRKVS